MSAPRPDIDPLGWKPPPAPALAGPFARNSRLLPVERWETGGIGPEDVAVDAAGATFTGLEDGRILRFSPEGREMSVVGETGGRPLGIEVDPAGRLVICDAHRGLLRMSRNGDLETLVDEFEGARFLFTNNAAVAADGTIYFTVTSTKFPIEHYMGDLMEHRPTGRLFAYLPDGTTELMRDGLYFANGVALSLDERFLLVAETGAYRINRIWLQGEAAGSSEVFADNLPGFPDNLSTGPSGVFWVALPTVRNPQRDALLPRPRVRRMTWKLPERFIPKAAPYGFVLGYDTDGDVVHNLQDPTGRFSMVTGAAEAEGWLYLGSLTGTAVGRVRLS